MELGADYVATGHYCRKGYVIEKKQKKYFQLLSGKDPNKDQSYFLCQLSQEPTFKDLISCWRISEVRGEGNCDKKKD